MRWCANQSIASTYEDISPYVNSIAVPTLVVVGEQDRQDTQDPLEQHQREVLPRIPGAKLHVIAQSGHLVPIDQPEELASVIRNFVEPLAMLNEPRLCRLAQFLTE
jgi:pimeloyl-ACP methyl ester carboxylesterase